MVTSMASVPPTHDLVSVRSMGLTVVRLCGGQVILDAEKIDTVTFLQFNEDAPNQHPIKKIDNDYWELTFDKIVSPGHGESGIFYPDGRFIMNNLRENNCSASTLVIPHRAIGKRSRVSKTPSGAANIRTRSIWSSRWTAPSSTSRSSTPPLPAAA